MIENALKKEQAKRQQDDDSSQTRLSQAAQAIRDSSVLQQMASSVNRGPQEVRFALHDIEVPLLHLSLNVKEPAEDCMLCCEHAKQKS